MFTSSRIGCSRCHRGASLTISGSISTSNLFDIGTGIRADVPSLHALWASAPYLHDGRVRTLQDVITAYNPDDRHGRTSHLTQADVDDLVHFLLAPFGEPTRIVQYNNIHVHFRHFGSTSRVTFKLSNSDHVSKVHRAIRPLAAPGWSAGISPSRTF